MVAASLVLPWLAGVVLLAFCWTRGRAGRWPAMLGYGYFIGTALTLVLFWLLHKVSGQWQPGVVLSLLALILIAAAHLHCRRLRALPGPIDTIGPLADHRRTGLLGQRLGLLSALLLLAFWAAMVGTESVFRPLFPWDAWETWSYVAKLVSTYPDALAQSPVSLRFEQSMVPLLQVWQARVLGGWHGSLVNVPWLAAGFALLLALYGQLRYADVSLGGALAAVLVLAFTPMFTTSVALGGYPELWTCGFFALAVMAASHALSSPGWQQAVLFLITAILVIFTDRYAAGYVALLWLVVLTLVLPWRLWLMALGVVALVLAVWSLTTGIDVELPKLGRVVIRPEQMILPKARLMDFSLTGVPWTVALERLLLDATWGLLWLMMVLIATCSLCQWRDRALRFLLLLVMPTFLLIMMLLLFSRLQAAVVEGTGINRWLLPLIPVIIYWGGLTFARRHRFSMP